MSEQPPTETPPESDEMVLAAAVERAAMRPRIAPPVDPSTVCASMLFGSGFAPTVGIYPCVSRCGGATMLPGVCPTCARQADRKAHDATLRAARDAIPERFQWARLDAPELVDRVAILAAEPGKVRRSEKLLSHRIVTLVGSSSAGKTSFGAALLRAVIDRGRFDALLAPFSEAERVGLRFRERIATDDKYREAPPSEKFIVQHMAAMKDYDLAWGARFFTARLLADPPEKGEAPAAQLAARASIVLIDDIGQEAGAGDSFRSNDRCRVVADVLAERHDRGLQTIVTTYGRQPQWSSWYGDGVARRYFTGDGVYVADMDKVPSRKVA